MWTVRCNVVTSKCDHLKCSSETIVSSFFYISLEVSLGVFLCSPSALRRLEGSRMRLGRGAESPDCLKKSVST